jgi:hypothetical protein
MSEWFVSLNVSLFKTPIGHTNLTGKLLELMRSEGGG